MSEMRLQAGALNALIDQAKAELLSVIGRLELEIAFLDWTLEKWYRLMLPERLAEWFYNRKGVIR